MSKLRVASRFESMGMESNGKLGDFENEDLKGVRRYHSLASGPWSKHVRSGLSVGLLANCLQMLVAILRILT
jgi:hypothetical protein